MSHLQRLSILSLIIGAFMLSASPAASAQEAADTLQLGNDRIVIILDEDGFVIRDNDSDDGQQARRELRLERRKHPRGIRMMRFDRDGSDTLHFDFDHITRFAERIPQDLEAYFDGLKAAPLGRAMEERSAVARMEAEAQRLSRRALRAEGAERRRIETELREHLDVLFAEKLALERKRLEHRRDRLEDEQRKLDERQQRHEEIIDRRLRDLLGERDVLEW